MSQKKNLVKANFYDKEFPSLSDVNIESNCGHSADAFSYSARLKSLSQTEVPKKKDVDAFAQNKKTDISASYKRPETDSMSSEEKELSLSPRKNFNQTNFISRNSDPKHSLAMDKDCPEIKTDEISTAWTVVKKKRASHENCRQSKCENNSENQSVKEILNFNKDHFRDKNGERHKNSRQSKNEYSAKNTSIKEVFGDNKDHLTPKNSTHYENNRQIKNEYNAEKSSVKETFSDNRNHFRFNNNVNNKNSFRSKSNTMEWKHYGRETESRIKADSQNNISAARSRTEASAQEVSHHQTSTFRAFKPDSSKKYSWSNKNKKGVSESISKNSSFKLKNPNETDKVLVGEQPLKKNGLNSSTSKTDPSHIKMNSGSLHKRVHCTLPENRQISYSENSTRTDTQRIPTEPIKSEVSSGTIKTSKKKRKSKLKRQAGLQRDKVQLIAPNVFEKILKLSNEASVQTRRNMTLNINDASEYPELGAIKSDSYKKCSYSRVVQADKDLKVEKEEINLSAKESSDKNSLPPTDIDSKTALSEHEEGSNEPEKASVRHNDPITISLLDIITTKTKKKNHEKSSKFLFGVPSSTTKLKRSAFSSNNSQNVNPLDSSKPAVRRGKEREKPKLKKPSHLKKIILLDRKKRKEQIRSNKVAGEFFVKDIVENINLESTTNINSVTSLLTSPDKENQLEAYSNQILEMCKANDESPLLLVESNNFAPCQNNDVSEDSNTVSPALCTQSYSCDPKSRILSAESDGGAQHLQIILHVSSAQHSALLLQNESCDSNDQFSETSPIFGETDGQKNSFGDNFLHSIRYLFADDTSCEVISTKPILNDIGIIFTEKHYSSVLDDDKISATISSNFEMEKNKSSSTIGDKFEVVNNNSSVINDDNNASTFLRDKIEIDVNSSADETENIQLSNERNSFTNFEMASFSSCENKLENIDSEEIKNGISQLKNEIPDLKTFKIESMIDNISDVSNSVCNENDFLDKVVQDSSVQKFSEKEIDQASLIVLHSKKFREYCDQFLCKSLDETVSLLLDDLARFQDRMHQKDPVKARMKRRLVYGIREIKRHMKLKKLKCVIVASDIEDSRSEGGLNDNLNELKSHSIDFQIPCIFSHTRRQLGKLCRKSAPVSAVGIFNYDGSEENFKKMLSLLKDCKKDYAYVVKSLSSKLTDIQVELLHQTKEENPANLYSVVAKLLKEYYPPEKLTKNTSESNDEDTSGSIEHKSCTEEEPETVQVYNILVKYKIINY